LNAFDSIESVVIAAVEKEPLEAFFFEQSDVPSPWNIYWTDAARESGGLDINDPVFGQHWTKYLGLHFGLFTDCDANEPCNCEGHNSVGAKSTVGHAAAAATPAKPLEILLIVVVPPTLTPSEIDIYSWHWYRCLIRCNVKFNRTSSGPGICRRPGHHHATHRSRQGEYGVQTNERSVQTDAGGIDAGAAVLTAHPRSTDGLRAPTTNHRSTTTDHRPTDETVPAPAMRPYPDGAPDPDSDKRIGRKQEETRSRRNGRRATTGTGCDNPGCTTIWRGSPQFEDVVSQCFDTGSQSGPGRPPDSGGQRSEISRLPGRFRVGWNSVDKLDCSTSNDHTTHARQLSRRAVEDAVWI